MRVKSNTRIAIIATTIADELGMKPTRAGWGVRAQQAARLERLLEAEERVSTHKPKRGVQAITGRTRVERAVEEAVIEVEEDNRPRQWGVVCQTVTGSIYVTTAVVDNDRVDVDTIAVVTQTDRVVGITNWVKDNRFQYLRSMFVGNIDHPDCAELIAEVIGYSSDNYLVWYIPAK